MVCAFDLTVSGLSGTTESATLKLSGLPYSSDASLGYVGTVTIGYYGDLSSKIVSLSGTVIPTSTQADLWVQTEPNKPLTKLTQADIKTNTRLVGTIQYLSAA